MTIFQHIQRLLVTWLVLGGLVACTATPGEFAPNAATEAAPAAASARTVLILWHAWPQPEEQALVALVERFNRATADVQILLQSRPAATLTADLNSAVAEGGGPHIAIVPSHTLGGLVEAGRLLPVEDLLPASEVARLLPAAVGAAQVGSVNATTLYGVPLSFDTLALFYNKANFAGPPPTDSGALLDVARGLTNTDSDPPIWGLAYNLSLDHTIGYLYAFGGRVFNEQGELVLGLDGHRGATSWLSWLASLREDERILASMDGITIDNALLANQALMTIDWAHAVDTYRGIWPSNLGVAPLPHLPGEGGAPQPYVQSDALVLNARLGAGDERNAAASFARYLIGEPAQRELLRAGRQPVLLSLDLNAEDEALPTELREAAQVFRAQGEAGQPMPNSRQANEIVWPTLSEMHAGALRRLLSPEQAVDGADASLRDRLELSDP